MNELLEGLKAAAEPTRLRILTLCARADLTVSDLVRILGQSQPRISHHLKLLTEAGLLMRYREGQWTYHRVGSAGSGGKVARAVVELMASEEADLSADFVRLDEVSKDRHAAAAAYFSANAENWDRVRSLHVDEAKLERAVADMVSEVEAKNLVDIGTGTGRMLELLSPRFDEAVGVDINKDMLRIARDNLERRGMRNCHVRLADMYRLPWADASFDCAVLHQVLHYAEQPSVAIAEAARVLRPNGSLLIVDFAPHDLNELRTSHAHRWLGFEDETISKACEACGLAVEKSRRLRGHPLVVSIWRARRRAPDMPLEGRNAA